MSKRSIKRVEINRDKLKAAILNNGYNLTTFGESIGRSQSYASNIISRGWCVEWQLEYICNKLGVQVKDILPEQKPEPKREQQARPMQMQIEFNREGVDAILDAFKALDERLDAMEKRLLEAASGNSAPDMLTNHEKAVLLLKQMSLYNARIEEIDYIKKCNELGIDAYTRNMAIKKLDGNIEKLGFGNNAKRVIIINGR